MTEPSETAKMAAALENRAHARLSELVEEARRQALHGRISVAIEYKGGRAVGLRRTTEGTDK